VLIVSELALCCCVDGWSRLAPATFWDDSENPGFQSFEGSHCKLSTCEPERSKTDVLYGDFSKGHLFSETSFGVWPRFQESNGCHELGLPGARPTTTADW